MAWIFLFIASFGEIFGVACLNMFMLKRTVFWLVSFVLVFFCGLFFLTIALQDIALGTGYAIWTGLGATGGVLIGIFFFKESASVYRLLFLTCIITGAIGLKLVTP